MKRKFTFLIAAAMMLLTMVATTSEMWGQTRDSYSYTFTAKQFTEYDSPVTLNGISWTASATGGNYFGYDNTKGQQFGKGADPCSALTLSISGISGTITEIKINTSGASSIAATLNVTVGGNSFGDSKSLTATATEYTFSGSASGTIAFNYTQTSSKAIYIKSISVTYSTGGGSDPSISASDVNIAYNATEGSIGYTLTNGNGNVTAAITTGDWLSLGTITESAVPFTCSANTGAERTATVTLSYTGATDKVVTVTQDAAPNNISDITTTNTAYTVIGTVVATNSRGFVIGDGTGYVYTYLNAAPSQAINDKVKIAGTTGTYGHILQFTNSATITVSETSNYNNTPAVTVVDGTALAAYNTDYQLSDYLQFEGTLSTTVDGNNTYYDISVGSVTARISYPTNVQTTALSSLVSKNVRVKGYFAGTSTKNDVTYYTIMLESVEEVTNPTLSVNPATAQAFTYVVGNGPSDDQMFTVTGTNLVSADITATVSSDYEITDDQAYSSSVTIASGDIVSVRLKAGLAKGTHNGALTLSSTDATDVVINLSGTVTGQTYTIEQYSLPATAHGTITFSPASPVEDGTEVTLTATPADGYDFTADSWVFYKESGQDYVVDNTIVVTNSKITMPAYNIWVDATFAVKPTYAITTVVTPDNSGTIATDNTAWEGKEVTVEIEAANGYTFSSIVISKTGDPETTIQTTGSAASGFTFTMPAYAVTATATFLSNTFEGSFAQVTATSALEDGGYYILYSTKAMNSTLTSGKMGATDVTINNNIIENPDRSIVWKLVKNGDNWDLYSEKEEKYCYIEGTNTSAFKMAESASYHYVVTAYATGGGFKFKTTHSSNRGISYGNNDFGSYADSNDPTVYLYKYTTLTERTITFNGNGGIYNEATTYTQTVYDGVQTALIANQFTKANSAFVGWALTADGDVVYDDQAQVTINADLNLYAKWATSYTLIVDNSIEGGTVSITGSITSAIEGTEITLSYTPAAGHAFSAWNVYKTGDPETTVTVTDNKFNMPAYNVTVSATFVEATTYSLVTNVNQIVSGKHYIIASGTDGSVKVMAGQNTNNRASVEATATNNVIPETEGIYEFVINGPVDMVKGNETIQVYTIYDTNVASTGYLYAASSSKNYLRAQSILDDNGRWTITISDNKATIKAQGTYTNNWMRNNGDLFSCYGSGQSDIYLYVKVNDNDLEFYGNTTYAGTSIPAGQTLTVGDGSVMTVPNNFENTTAANLIIEDGGQLIHTAAVNATVKKDVTGSPWSKTSAVDGWYTIASPVANAPVSSATTGNYDFFAYSEANAKWLNQKVGANSITNFVQGIGYLYAHENGVELSYAGEMVGTGTEITKELSYACENASYQGINLMGNPFSRNLVAGDIEIAGTPLTTYYTVEGGNELTAKTLASTPIKPGQGFMVQATASSQNLVFNPTSKDRSAAKVGYISIVAGNSEFTDNAFVQVGGGNTLHKMTLSDNSSIVYVMNNGNDYAAATIDALEGSMPVCFKANALGSYTITIEAIDINADYLHLIDNFTGEDINLLLEPSYSFIASNGDRAERFTLVFKSNGSEGTTNEIFAFQNGSDIVVNGEGELQVFDVTGRMVATQHVNGVQTVNVPSQGVFIFKLNEKTQKIVVR